MNLLLDTHSLIWFLNGDEKLSVGARNAIENIDNMKFVSIASIWEIAIKFSIGKLELKKGLPAFLELIDDNGFEILPIALEHIVALSSLPFHHRDPFDRLLVAQSIEDALPVITIDENINKYKVKTIW